MTAGRQDDSKSPSASHPPGGGRFSAQLMTWDDIQLSCHLTYHDGDVVVPVRESTGVVRIQIQAAPQALKSWQCPTLDGRGSTPELRSTPPVNSSSGKRLELS
jgi:hypothetical protein